MKPQCPYHHCDLEYEAEIGAPGYGRAFKCPIDGKVFHVYGLTVEDPAVDGVRELTVEDVI